MALKTVLLVEDNSDDECLALRALSGRSAAVRVARDGEEALGMLFDPAGGPAPDGAGRTPHLVLLDIGLPRMDGLEVLRRIRLHERTRHLPVVMLTSSDAENHRTESYRLGANSVVLKAADAARFESDVRRLADYWLTVNLPSPVAGGT
jgi:two-component system, response regulator